MLSFESHPLHPGKGVPIFIAAGVLKEPAQLKPFVAIEDPEAAPILTLGGFSLSEWCGNANPGETDFVYSNGVAGNARNLPNPGREGILALKEPIAALTKLGIKTIVQVTNLPHERPLDVVKELVLTAAEVNPTAIEFNLSCPNGVRPDGSFHPPTCNDADLSGEILEAARQEIGYEICFGAKDSPHVMSLEDEIDEAAIASLASASSPYVDFVTGINTIGNQPFPGIVTGRGGMSGPVVVEVAHQHQELWLKYAPDTAYLSCGGVDTSNADVEIHARTSRGALRVGGAQEFYRARNPLDIAANWAIKWASSLPV
jgi:dihydroorotate dehydrogenase